MFLSPIHHFSVFFRRNLLILKYSEGWKIRLLSSSLRFYLPAGIWQDVLLGVGCSKMAHHRYFPSVQQPLCFCHAMECYYNITLVDRFYSYPLLNRGCHILHVDNLITPSVSEDTRWMSSDEFISLIPQHYNLTLFISSWATKSCPGFCHVRIFTYLSVAKRKQAKL